MTSRALKYLYILTIWLCLHTTYGREKKSPSLAVLVPRIDQEKFHLEPSGQYYNLMITLPNGSTRIEHVELRESTPSEQELHVTGKSFTFYEVGELVTTYEAGKGGSFAKYKYEVKDHIGAIALKSAAG